SFSLAPPPPPPPPSFPTRRSSDLAFGCHRFLRKCRERGVTRGILVREGFARAAEQHRGARLTLGNLGRRQLSPVHLLEIDELARDRKSTRLNSSHLVISYAVFCLK